MRSSILGKRPRTLNRLAPSGSRIFMGVAFALVLTRGAQAGQVVSTGPVNQYVPPSLTCTVANVGPAMVRVNAVKFIDDGGNVQGFGGGNCTFPGDIFPGLTCYQDAGSPHSGQFARCEVDVAGSAKYLRVHISSYDGSRNLLDTSEGR
jgi:hypothetical protein